MSYHRENFGGRDSVGVNPVGKFYPRQPIFTDLFTSAVDWTRCSPRIKPFNPYQGVRVRYVARYYQACRPRCFNRYSGGGVVSVFRPATDYSGKVSPGNSSVKYCRSTFPAKGTSCLPNAFDQAVHGAIASSSRHLGSGLRPTVLDASVPLSLRF